MTSKVEWRKERIQTELKAKDKGNLNNLMLWLKEFDSNIDNVAFINMGDFDQEEDKRKKHTNLI